MESKVLSSECPAGLFSRPPCLPLAPECAPVSAGGFQGRKPSCRAQRAPAAPCITGGVPGEVLQ